MNARPDESHRTPQWGYPDDPPCEDCGAPAGHRCKPDCTTGLGEDAWYTSDRPAAGPDEYED